MAGYSVTYSVVDNATKQIDAINRRIAQTRAPLDRMSRQMSRFIDVSGLRKIATGFEWIGKAAGSVLRTLTSIIPVMGTIIGGASIAGMVKLVSSYADWSRELVRAADNIGTTTQKLQQFEDATRLAGGNAAEMRDSLKGLHDKLADFNIGGSSAALTSQWANQLGINLKDANGVIRSATDLLPELIRKINELKDPADRAAAANALLGSSGENLIQTFRQSSKSFLDWFNDVQRYKDLTDDQKRSLQRFAEAQGRIGVAFDRLGQQIAPVIAKHLGPLLEKFAVFVEQNTPAILGAIDQLSQRFAAWLADPETAKAFVSGIKAVADSLVWVSNNLDTVKTAVEVIAGLFALKWAIGIASSIATVAQAFGVVGVGGAAGLGILGALGLIIWLSIEIVRHWDEIKQAGKDLADAVSNSFERVKKTMSDFWSGKHDPNDMPKPGETPSYPKQPDFVPGGAWAPSGDKTIPGGAWAPTGDKTTPGGAWAPPSPPSPPSPPAKPPPADNKPGGAWAPPAKPPAAPGGAWAPQPSDNNAPGGAWARPPAKPPEPPPPVRPPGAIQKQSASGGYLPGGVTPAAYHPGGPAAAGIAGGSEFWDSMARAVTKGFEDAFDHITGSGGFGGGGGAGAGGAGSGGGSPGGFQRASYTPDDRGGTRPAGGAPRHAGGGAPSQAGPVEGVTGLAATPFGALIARGEGSYNSVNRGKAGGYRSGTEDLGNKTVGEVMADQAAHKYNAAGRYQIIAGTLREAAKSMGLKGDEKFDQKLQDRIFSEHLAGTKRPAIADYLSGRSNDIRAALKATALEWASVADPDTGRSAYEGQGNNRSSISVAEMTRALEETRKRTMAGTVPPSAAPGSGYKTVSKDDLALPGAVTPPAPVGANPNAKVQIPPPVTAAAPASTVPGPAPAPVNGSVDVSITHKNPPPNSAVTATGTGAVNVAPPRVEHQNMADI